MLKQFAMLLKTYLSNSQGFSKNYEATRFAFHATLKQPAMFLKKKVF